MTPQEKVAAWALSQVGYAAYNGKHNKYAQALDKTKGYNGPKDGYDWCESFHDCGMMECFGLETAWKMMNQPMGGCGAGCEQSAAYYRAAGRWSSSPSLGAQIYFGSVGDEYHTGFVVGYDASTVWTAEGNTGYSLGYPGGAVLKQSYPRSSSKIAGYGVPDWSLAKDGDAVFSDVGKGTAHADAIKWAKERGITTGYADGTFRPYSPTTRADMAAFLYRASGSPKPFKDVAPGSPRFAEISWMAEKDIAKGYSDGRFRPNDSVARRDMAAFLYRLAGSPAYEPSEADETFFSDVDSSTPHAKEIWWLAAQGISEGWIEGGRHYFRPSEPLTRSDAMALIQRTVGR